MKNPEPMIPASTGGARLVQYVSALLRADGDTFTSRNLGAAGRIWISSVKVLTHAGMIKRIRDYTPIRYQRCVSRVKLKEWIDNFELTAEGGA